MAEGKKSAVIYCDLITTVEKMKDVDAGKLFKHFLRYINDLSPAEPNGIVGIVFEPIKQQLKRDLKKWETKSLKNAETAKARWEKMRNDAFASNGIKKDAKSTDTDNVTVNDTDNVNDTDIFKKEEKNLIDVFFKDLENSRNFETIGRDLKVHKGLLVGYIEKFRIKSNTNYKDFNAFCDHFKKWVNIQINPIKEASKIDSVLTVAQQQQNELKQKYAGK